MKNGLTLLLFSSFFFYGTAWAKSPCPETENYTGYPLIFKGIAKDTHENQVNISEKYLKEKNTSVESVKSFAGAPQTTFFEVVDVYKGEQKNEYEIHHFSGYLDGVEYTENQTYIIFANQNEKGEFITNSCDPSPIWDDEKHLLNRFGRPHSLTLEQMLGDLLIK